MTILMTGFEPFGTVEVNPSQQIVERIAKRQRDDVVTDVLPVAYGLAGQRITELIQTHQPRAIMMLGVAAKREKICLERIALNISDANLPDNTGHHKRGEYIVEGAPLAYESNLPLHEMCQALEAQNIPVRISNHAGAYLCNYVFYLARHRLIDAKRWHVPCGFVHVPGVDSMALEQMIDAIDNCLAILRTHIVTQQP